MEIFITSGIGYGKTSLSAFDSALKDAGVYNYNLIALSSVIPPHSTIIGKKWNSNGDEYGHKLYIVKAEMRSTEPNKYIGAAIGWHQLSDGRGVFVEHETIGDTKQFVQSTLKKDVQDSLTDLCMSRNYPLPKGNFQMKVQVTKVKSTPTSILVIAVYKSESWR